MYSWNILRIILLFQCQGIVTEELPIVLEMLADKIVSMIGSQGVCVCVWVCVCVCVCVI